MRSDSLTPEQKYQLVEVTDRTDLKIDTRKFNSKPGEIISIEDVESGLIRQYYLSEEKKKLKRKLWL